MPTRTSEVGGYAALEVFDNADANNLPAGEIGYEERTSNFGLDDDDDDIAGLSVTVTVAGARRLKITGHALFDVSAAGAANFSGYIKQSTTQIGLFARGECDASEQVLGDASVRVNVTAGSYTFKLSGQRTAGTGVVTVVAASNNPAYISVEDVGPSLT